MTTPRSIDGWLKARDEQAPAGSNRSNWEGVLEELAEGGKRIEAEIVDASGELICSDVIVYRAVVVEPGEDPKLFVWWQENGRPYECCAAKSWVDGLDTACVCLDGVVGDLQVKADPNWIAADVEAVA